MANEQPFGQFNEFQTYYPNQAPDYNILFNDAYQVFDPMKYNPSCPYCGNNQINIIGQVPKIQNINAVAKQWGETKIHHSCQPNLQLNLQPKYYGRTIAYWKP